ncbi:zinc finger, CCHC-type containing protein [Tanacetum coccineum]
MAIVAMKHMALNFAKLDKFEGVEFRRWQKKINFLISSMSVVCVPTTPILEHDENATIEQIRKRNKWENDDYVCKGLIILGSHLHIEKSLREQDKDKTKSNNVDGPSFFNMVEYNNSTRYNDNKGKRKHQDTKAAPNKKSKVTSWKRGKPGHLKKDCKGGKVGNKANGLRINGLVNASSNSLKDLRFSSGKIVSLFNVLHVPNIRKNLVSSSVLNNCGYKQSVGIVHGTTAPYTPQQNGISEMKNLVLKEVVNSMFSYFGLSQGFWGEAIAVVRLRDPKMKTLGERGIECIFVENVEHSKDFIFYVIEPNEFVLINSIIESRDAIFDGNRFSSVSILSLRIPKGTKDIGVLEVSDEVPPEVTEEVADEVFVQQPEPELRRSSTHRTPMLFGP